MRKFFTRTVTLLLIPALIEEPLTASGAALAARTSRALIQQDSFAREALAEQAFENLRSLLSHDRQIKLIQDVSSAESVRDALPPLQQNLLTNVFRGGLTRRFLIQRM